MEKINFFILKKKQNINYLNLLIRVFESSNLKFLPNLKRNCYRQT